MKALVTGGAGFIGSNLANKLNRLGHEVVVLDNLFLGVESNLDDNVKFVEGSVDNRDRLKQVFQTTEIDTVFHHAAMSNSLQHQEQPVNGLETNVRGFLKTMQEAEKNNVDKLVYASTSSMYGSVEPPHRKGVGEKATNLYAASKMAREEYAHAFSKNNELDTVGLRYFSVYGPNEKAKGEYANIITQFLWKMMNEEEPVIWGDGSQRRDFTHVEDVVKANIAAYKTDVTEEVYDIGTGHSHSFNEVVKQLNEELGTDIIPKYREIPVENYVHETLADPSKAEQELLWQAEKRFEEGVKQVVNHYS